MRAYASLRIGHRVRFVDRLRERTARAFRAVRVQHRDAAAGLDLEIQDVPDVLVDERLLRAPDLLPDDHVIVLEQLGRPLSRKLRRVFGRCRLALRGDANADDCQDGSTTNHDQHATHPTIQTDHGAPPENSRGRA